MSVQEEIPKINNELERARHDLNETLIRINRKVERTEEEFSPNHSVKRLSLSEQIRSGRVKSVRI